MHMTQHRRMKISDLVRQRGVIRVSELADRFQVSEVTIRNDLDRLEKEGHLTRDRGGAIATESLTAVTSLLRVDERAALNRAEKRRISRAAVELVKPNDTIILDAGTTVGEMCGPLKEAGPVTIVTNGLNVVVDLVASSNASIIFLGGTFSRESSSTIGSLTEHNLNELVVQKLFLGTQAMDLENGLTDSTMEIAQVKRAMIRAARQVILLTDSSKWGKAGLIKVAPLTEIDLIITDTGFPVDARADIERLGIEMLVV